MRKQRTWNQNLNTFYRASIDYADLSMLLIEKWIVAEDVDPITEEKIRA